VIAGELDHPTDTTGGRSTEGRSAEVVVATTRGYHVDIDSACALTVRLTWVARPEPPLRTGPATPDQF
jgi:hypothetical protein